MQFNPITIEEKWRKEWAKTNRWKVDLHNPRKPYYNLMMFPYPSAEGLHIGNVYAFTGSDIHGRFRRLQGNQVFEPIGFDAFGINTENFAIKSNVHPAPLTKKSIDNFREQLKKIGALFDWDFEIQTNDPMYYKWTQWLFLQLYKKGLAYRKKADVDWCSNCKTALAAEQVTAGKCERCDNAVVKKELEQWFLKITDYAEKLLKNLDTIDWSSDVKTVQKNWIGRSEGTEIEFPIVNSSLSIRTFTTRIDTIFGSTYVVLAPDHVLVEEFKERIINIDDVEKYQEETKEKTDLERSDLTREKTGVELRGIRAINPATKSEVPIWIADYILKGYGTGAIMAVPAHDSRDLEFAKKFGLPVREVIANETLCNSGKFNGMDSEEAKKKISEEIRAQSSVKYHLRDWLISRQRYWGPPIPIIYCDNCGIVPVPEEDLPVLLPDIEDFRPTGTDKSPLASVEKFVNTTCPVCKSSAKRETDVSDTFLDSSWYFLRHPSVGVSEKPFDPEITKTWLPVNMYIGGKEHSVRHLLYARFITMVLHDLGLIDFEEPFSVFRAHGLLIRNGAKISKSRGNIVSPDGYFAAYGADTIRVYLMFLGPFNQGGDWRDNGILGISRFIKRVWALGQSQKDASGSVSGKNDNGLEKIRHKAIARVTEDLEKLRYNTAISGLMEYTNSLGDNKEILRLVDIETLLVLLAPFAPHITEELWEQTGHKDSVHDQSWPVFDEALIKEKTITMPVQINGKVRATINVPSGTKEGEASSLALTQEQIQKWTEGKEIKKVVFVEDKLINFVI